MSRSRDSGSLDIASHSIMLRQVIVVVSLIGSRRSKAKMGGGRTAMKAYLRLAMVTIAVGTVTTTFSASADEAPAARTPTEQTPAAQAPPAASAGEVEALKRQNAELQQRLEKLSGEMDQIKGQLAEREKPVVAQPPTKKPVTGILDMEIYGYVKLDAAYDTSRISFGDYLRWVESEQLIRNDNQFNLTATETRLGVRVKGPTTESFRSSGDVEIDFYSFVGSEFTPSPRMRYAYVNFEWPNAGIGVLAGQAPDVISPLTEPTVNFAVGWWLGDIGFRRPPLRVNKTFYVGWDNEFKVGE